MHVQKKMTRRKKELLNILHSEYKVPYKLLSEIFDVSISTVYRAIQEKKEVQVEQRDKDRNNLEFGEI